MNLKAKKLLSVLLSCTVLGAAACGSVSAFNFPEPDWGQLLKEKEAMVLNTELDLYGEGDLESAPYFGARLEPRGGAYLGMVTENSEGFGQLGSYLTYIDDMNQEDIYYPANEIIKNSNSAVMVGWTIGDMGSVDLNKMRSVLDTLNSYNKPMFIRFANEMNVSSLGNEPEQYKEIFRAAANLIHEYPNFAVVWAPNDIGGLDRPFEYFYPGDEYVDWVGVSCYSIKYFMGNQNTSRNDSVYFMTGDYAWTTNRIKPIIDFMARNNINKPVMISEGGVATGNQYGEALDWWAAPRLRNMLWSAVMKYPQIKMINYFNAHMANESEWFDISDYGYAADIFREAADSGAYIKGTDKPAEFAFRRADNGAVFSAENGAVKLYTMAYVPGQPDAAVNYNLDGNWYHSSNQIPYTCNMDLSAIADGAHTLTISAGGQNKDYTFFKRGSAIKFGADFDASQIQAEQPIKVTLNGQLLEFDRQPVMHSDRTLVPLRKIFEALGAEVNWDDNTQTVTASRGDINISLTIGSNQLYVNGAAREIDVPAMLISDRTMVPTRAVTEAFGCDVGWDNDTQTVIIKTK